ncbi:DNA (cytosine-5-)-methyltransferase [Rhizobium leguminosarum bv. viciae]|uniref:DNA cytosine methyltransferase n=1 Tax=Rhizobium leguminosarum TaxID=384 RepID=UPI00103C9A76|nr:DNA (cytosine-5-)-methyltransferase [Rhizobium leguminosarum]MBY5873746.1 DNA (cytosine-5-)-methyltransferase [Rhizobium leguminosarum]TBY57696.1 DNA (cytosine-5-)-methyltransferase [Rhizobium leguminosarum bv. viciae]
MRVVELFAGAGGMSLGLSQAGMHLALAFEYQEAMLRIYRKNLQSPIRRFGGRNHAHQYDLTQYPDLIPTITTLSPDVLVGGPPCQDFSPAGNRVEGANAKLTPYYAQIICVVRPEWFILENVSRARKAKAYAVAKKLLEHAGYGLSENVLVASKYGVPQRRKRLILIGRLGEQHGFLDSAILAKASKKEMTIRDAFGDRFGDRVYFHARASDRRSIWEAKEPAPTVRSGSGRSGERLRGLVDEFYDPTMEELSLFQGFPGKWDWSGETATNIQTMIGNAVPPPLARAVGEVIVDRHFGRSIPEIPGGFNKWLADKGYGDPSIRNVRSRVNAGRRLLLGRTYADPTHEIGALETVLDTIDLTVKAKSDIRISMRLMREFIASATAAPMVSSSASREFAETRVRNRQRKVLYPNYRREEPEPYDGYPDVDDGFEAIIEETA